MSTTAAEAAAVQAPQASPGAPAAAASGTAALQVEGIEKHFGKVVAVGGIDLTVEEGEFVTLLGPSGCGKTTLLRMIAGIESPTAGRISIGGTAVSDVGRKLDLPPEKRQLGMVFQSYAVWPHMTVERNVAYPLKRSGVPRAERRQRTIEALDAVGLAHLIDRYPGEMSGGQQQRIALARAIVARPRLLLLDEPLSNLDARLRESMRLELKRLQVELGLTTIYVTHDQSEALAMSDRILVINAGRVLQAADPETVYRRPANLTVARFLGVKNIVDGIATGPDTIQVAGEPLPGATCSQPFATGDAVSVAIRPDALVPVEPGTAGAIHGTVAVAEFLGTGYEHQVDVGESGVPLVVHTSERLGHRGDAVCLGLKDGGAVAFPAEERSDDDD